MGRLSACDLLKERQRWGGSRPAIQPRLCSLEQRRPPGKGRVLSDLHKVPCGLGVALSECIWYSLGSICGDALEFEKDRSGCILEDGQSGGKETSERGLVQVSSNVGLH